MSLRKIRLLGDPALRTECAPVERFDDELRDLVEDLLDTMYDAEGIGLAAPQVGVPRRIFVYDTREPDGGPGVLVNPEVVERSGHSRDEEGCLSIPGLVGTVERSERVVVEGRNASGEEVRIEAEGLLSRCLQHEGDHLDGILFLDHLSPLQRNLLMKKWAKRESPEPEDRRAGAL